MDLYLERVVDLIDRDANALEGISVDRARAAVLSGDPARVRALRGSFALIAHEGKMVRMARSLDRPLRYFLAKRAEGPALFVASRIDVLYNALQKEGLDGQFHPSYTRMVPAHHITELHLIGCPDPAPFHLRFFDPERNGLVADTVEIGRRYVGALAEEVAGWLWTVPEREPIGVSFSGGIDSGAVFLTTYHAMKRLGMNLSRLKAFTLTFGDGPDLFQAREFLERVGLGMFLEPIEADPADLDVDEAIRVVEDYKPLDVESASMALALCRGIRQRYPGWVHLADGDGGDENLKDYPIEENPELTIRSVVSNPMLYQEGWGVGKIKHSLTYSGGFSRAVARSYAPARHHGFQGFSPFTRPSVITVAEAIPFDALTRGSVERLYALKGDIVGQGVKALTGMEMPVFPKRRFQHGAMSVATLRSRLPEREADYRKRFLAIYE